VGRKLTRRWGSPLAKVLFGVLVSGPGWAQDADEDDFEFDDGDFYEAGEDDEEDEDVQRLEEGDTETGEEDPDDSEWEFVAPDEEESELEFDDEFGDDSRVQIAGPGQDTARIYRAYLEEVSDLVPDEEALAWERYLKKYPNSLFQSRIDEHLTDLGDEMYDERIEDRYIQVEDAGKAEIHFSQPLLLDSLDPRNKIRVGFEWGYPSYFNLYADYEHQLTREISVHGSIGNEYTGLNATVGGKYALLKSARTNTLVTGMLDAHLNMDPVFPALRPQVGVGHRFEGVAEGLDVMGQGGIDLVIYNGAISPRYLGGANATLKLNDTVRAFFETYSYTKDIFSRGGNDKDDASGSVTPDGSFRFNVVTFGIKFTTRKGQNTDLYETSVGATAPYSYYYWSYHYGSVTGDFQYYL
jgi:hypothetical protein